MAKITVAFMRQLEQQLQREEITYSRMVELLNEKAKEKTMSATFIKSKSVCKNNDVFILHVGFSHYDVGVQIHKWGIRVMLIWWHTCIHWNLK